MTKIITIIGPNAVGKSTTANTLLEKCTGCAYVDADWCRAINPFLLSESTKIAVIENIYCMFRNYIMCEDIKTIVFPYAFHGERKEIFDRVISKLNNDGLQFDLNIIILKCSLNENIRRAKQDNRDSERIKRGIDNTFSFYDTYKYPCIDTTALSSQQVAERIIDIAKIENT